MKLAPITVFIFRDSEGFASAISQALSSSSFTPLEDSFELSLEGYGIKDHKASGNVLHYLDNHRSYKVSIVIMQHYEPPVLACALNEVLNKIVGGDPSSTPTLLVPFLVESSKVKGNSKSLRSDESRALTYGIQIGQITETMQTLLKKTQEPPSSLRIQQENFACFLHFVRVMKLPTFFLIGQTSQYLDNKSPTQHEAICEIGEILASSTGLQFSEDRVIWNPKKASKEIKEPWRDLYG